MGNDFLTYTSILHFIMQTVTLVLTSFVYRNLSKSVKATAYSQVLMMCKKTDCIQKMGTYLHTDSQEAKW